jgi:hypothetical protein
MKKYIIVLFLVLCFCNLYAQEYEYVDSLESVQINIKAGFDSTYGSTYFTHELKKENEEIKKMVNTKKE